MNKWIGCLLLLACTAHQGVAAKEWFEDAKLQLPVVGEKAAPDDTIAGYPIYLGAGDWRYMHGAVSTSGGSADSIPMGVLRLSYTDPQGLVSVQGVAANLRSNNGGYWTGTPCSANHLVVRSKGKGRTDDCMTIDAIPMTVGFDKVVGLDVRVTESSSSGRYYAMSVSIPVERMGLPGTSLADWTAARIQEDPNKKQLVEKLTTWAEKLQDSAGKLMDYSKPKDAFSQVPNFADLLVSKSPSNTARQ